MSLPLIDFNSSQFDQCLTASLQKTGFAILVNHPIDQKLILDFHNQWKLFFNSEDKFQYKPDSTALDGYFPYGLEDASPGKYRDLKEYYYFAPWGKCPPSLLKISSLLFEQYALFGEQLLNIVEASLPDDIRRQLSVPLAKMVHDSKETVLRILHYPPLSALGQIEERAIRATEHEDLALLALVTAITGSGLQLKDNEGTWYDVPTGSEYLIIHMGDMLNICTQGFYRATTHRVVNPVGDEAYKSRYSNVLFVTPHANVVLKEGLTASDCLEKHIHKRLHALEVIEAEPA